MALHLSPIVEGNDAGETIVFVHGWPDDASVWDSAVAALRPKYRCVRMTLPNFAGDRTTRWGYGTTEIIDALEALVREVGRGGPVTLVLHDWGCYWGHALHHRCPDLVARIAGVDVAPHTRPSSARSILGIISYQWWLLAAFALGGPVGDGMTRSFAATARAPGNPARMNAWMNYPYRNVWADLLTGRVRTLLGGYWPTCPVLFVYGERKPFPFHSDAWLDHVRKIGGEVVGLPCGHWVPCEPAFATILARWLESHPAAVRGPRAGGSPDAGPTTPA
jgi:pimeloyl-ACP methyl ester carboxylesterase